MITATRAFGAIGLVALASAALAACGGSQEAAQPSRDCLRGWNALENSRNQTRVAGTYTYAKVAGREAGCAFAFHGDDPPVLVLSGRWEDERLALVRKTTVRELGNLPHGTPPSPEDNMVVTAKGRLLSGRFPASTRITKPRAAPHWLLLRARRDASVYQDLAPRAIEISRRGDLWRVALEGKFICDLCMTPVGKPEARPVVIEEFRSDTRAGAGISYG